MKRHQLHLIALCSALALAMPAASETTRFSFGIIPPPANASEAETFLREAIEQTDGDNLAFVVATGLKAPAEPCTDSLYEHRKSLLDGAKNGLIVSLAASDWAICKSETGKSSAIAKLSRLRELFFVDEFSLGATKIPVTRHSTAAKFRIFVENARWEIGSIMFATINLPSNNNHYIYDAGRNSEFEDRLVANRNWLNRVFFLATRGNAKAVVLFSDANPLAAKQPKERRDGYAEVRKQIVLHAANFSGKVLLIHRKVNKSSGSPKITWRGNLGQLGTMPGWTKVTIDHDSSSLFIVEPVSVHSPNGHASRPQHRTGEGVALR
ncbi:MAG TPA: hypothetical protein VGE12_13040 [Noviherbaspirillum sp.]